MNTVDEEYTFSKTFTGLCPAWINAPSTLQPAHKWHGKNVVAIHEKNGGFRCCCIDEEKPSTFSVPENTDIVPGWKKREKHIYLFYRTDKWHSTNSKELVYVSDDYENGLAQCVAHRGMTDEQVNCIRYWKQSQCTEGVDFEWEIEEMNVNQFCD